MKSTAGSRLEDSIEVVRYPGLSPYRDLYVDQIDRRDAVAAGAASPALFIVEHEPVITLGREANADNLLRARDEYVNLGIDLVEADRGGDVTYHGPGQLVVYPILPLERMGIRVRAYLRTLEQIIINTLADFQIEAWREEGLTGVWTDTGKIAAIGIGLRKHVSYHGAALNVAPNLEHFRLIVPCGIQNKPVTSMEAVLEDAPTLDRVAATVEAEFTSAFALTPVRRTPLRPRNP